MRVIVLFIICLLSVTSCNQVNNELKPVEPETVPSKVIAQVKEWYPDAQNLVFKPLLEKLVWEAKFDSGSDKYTTLADSTKIFETYRLIPQGVPDKLTELMSTSSYNGGTFKTNWEGIGFVKPDTRNKLIYNFHGTDYVFLWVYVDGRIAGATFQDGLYQFSYDNINVLPTKIKTYLEGDPALKFVNVEFKILQNYARVYHVLVSMDIAGVETYANMYFNESGDLKWFSRVFNEPESVYSPTNYEKLPDAIQQYLDASPELTDFVTERIAAYQWMGEYRGITCYTIRFRHKIKREECEFLFDMDGNLFTKNYYFNI